MLDLPDGDPPVLVQVRRWAADVLGAVAADHLGDVLLVATELVTNAYDHGYGPRRLRMSQTSRPCRVRIEVADANPRRPVVLVPGEGAVGGGRGMLLVDKLAERWGVRDDQHTGGKTVWAEIGCAGTDQLPCPTAGEHTATTSGG
jgi:anti-sigma regulatory factor (Ser/Thr protein kinase)